MEEKKKESPVKGDPVIEFRKKKKSKPKPKPTAEVKPASELQDIEFKHLGYDAGIDAERELTKILEEEMSASSGVAIVAMVSAADLETAKKMIKIYQSAIDRKLEFNLTFDTVRKLMSYDRCYYTGRKFEEDGVYARSFDRIDSNKGYIEGNVVACTVDINGKKSNLSLEEIKCLYEKLVKRSH